MLKNDSTNNVDQLQLNLAGSCFPVKLEQKTSQIKKLTGIDNQLMAKAIKSGKVEYGGSNDNGTWIIESAGKEGSRYLWNVYFRPLSVITF